MRAVLALSVLAMVERAVGVDRTGDGVPPCIWDGPVAPATEDVRMMGWAGLLPALAGAVQPARKKLIRTARPSKLPGLDK